MDYKIKTDKGKARLTLVPTKIIYAIARVREYAVNGKYKDPNGWKRVEPERYRDALYRHLLAYLDDPFGADEESGLPHLWHIATNVAFLIELEWSRWMDENRKKLFKDRLKQAAKRAEWEDIKRHGASKKAKEYFEQYVKPKEES